MFISVNVIYLAYFMRIYFRSGIGTYLYLAWSHAYITCIAIIGYSYFYFSKPVISHCVLRFHIYPAQSSSYGIKVGLIASRKRNELKHFMLCGKTLLRIYIQCVVYYILQILWLLYIYITFKFWQCALYHGLRVAYVEIL